VGCQAFWVAHKPGNGCDEPRQRKWLLLCSETDHCFLLPVLTLHHHVRIPWQAKSFTTKTPFLDSYFDNHCIFLLEETCTKADLGSTGKYWWREGTSRDSSTDLWKPMESLCCRGDGEQEAAVCIHGVSWPSRQSFPPIAVQSSTPRDHPHCSHPGWLRPGRRAGGHQEIFKPEHGAAGLNHYG